MAALQPPVCDFGWQAPHFTLPATDGSTYKLADVAGEQSTLVMFICNHCPFVLAIMDKIIRDAHDMKEHGIGVVAICSNDPVSYPADSFENMQLMAEKHAFPFPYLHDADQSVAKDYDAVCTPDFFGFNKDMQLQYRGRLDATRMGSSPSDLRRDLFEAMKQIAETGKGPEDQIPSIGCSIKWK
ncbi:thioredoxin family protein [Roseibium sp. HPY-6]|uniref:thioredoxin family protein n=1 Tax=Roseibium sp. HPY-6 TaxID=3229852 RepID=UPI00338EB22B